MAQPLVSIITVNYRRPEETCDLLDTLRRIRYANLEVILVDNAVEQGQPELFMAHYPGLRYLHSPHNLGFAGGTNLGMAAAKGAYLLWLNNDTLVPEDFLEPLVAVLEADASVGIVSPKIYYYERSELLQYAGMPRPSRFTGRTISPAKNQPDHARYSRSGNTGLAHGAAMLIRREVLEELGPVSEAYFLYYEEVDYCEQAAKRGWQCYYEAGSQIVHRESIALGAQSPLKTYYLFRNRWLFMRRCRGLWQRSVFALYYLACAVPVNLLRFVRARKWAHVGALLRAIGWHFRYPTGLPDRDGVRLHYSPKTVPAHVAP